MEQLLTDEIIKHYGYAAVPIVLLLWGYIDQRKQAGSERSEKNELYTMFLEMHGKTIEVLSELKHKIK